MPRLQAPSDDDESRSVSSTDETMEVAPASAKKLKGVKDEVEQGSAKKLKGRPAKKEATPPPEEEEDEDEEGEDEEDDGDVYVVEAIINHRFDPDGLLKFHVRWKDYPKMKDHTWEPEDNLGTANEVLEEYIQGVGGRDALDKVPVPKAKKRGRQSTNGNGTPSGSQQQNGNKKARKLESEETEDTPQPSKATGLPPGNWEDLIAHIDTMDRQVGGLYVLLTFKDGQRVRQPVSTVYKRCPQKMLQFYESHLSIVPATRATEESTNIEV